MSWALYCENLVNSGSVERAAICGIEDGVIWSQSPGLNMTTTELKTVSSAFEDPTNVRSSGFNLGGEKFFCLQVDEGQIQGKRGSGGVSIAKTLKCIVIGTYQDGQQPGNCRKQVEHIKDYLSISGF